jgi:hypothetical protein
MGLFTIGIIFILFIILILIVVCIIINQYATHIIKGGSNYISNDEIMYYSICNHDYGLKYEKLESILQKHNFIIVSADKPAHVSFGSSEKITIHNGKKSYYDPLFITQRAAIKNTLGGQKQIIDKVMLFKTIRQLIPNGYKYLPKTYTINEFKNFVITGQGLQGKCYILKKDKTSKQQGVRVFFDMTEYNKIIKELNIKNDAIISEYILNPKTIEGKKINIRLFVILSIESGIKRCYIHDEITISTALKQYVASDWLNPEIHISGGKYTTKYYKWPHDVYNGEMPSDAKHNFEAFKKTLAMGIALTNMSIYNEFFIGYKVFAIDVMLTEDNNFFILEANNCIGFGCAGFGITDQDECVSFSNRFSEDYFSFILNSVIFPPLGIKRRPIALAEVITVGTLSPFSGVLIGDNQCILIPLSDAHDYEIEEAKKIHFYHLSLESLLKDSNSIFLIKKNKSMIGYISIKKDNNMYYLTIAIEKQYQNRGIATAMIAQILEIYAVKYFINGGKLCMKKPPVSIFIDKIAHRLKFTLHNNIYERQYRITDTVLNKILNNKLLTCNVHISDGTDTDSLLHIINKYMANTISQFVHLSFTTIDKNNYKMMHASTGSKFGHHFITQGAELKSSLNIKILYGVKLREYINNDNYFVLHDKIILDDIIGVNIYFVLYMRNGLKTCHVMDYYTYDKMSNGNFINIKDPPINFPMDKIKNFIQKIAQFIIKNDFSIYSESNAGFNVFRIYIQIIDNTPKIKLCTPNVLLINYKNESKSDHTEYIANFSKKYYEWLCHCVIFPHFGLLKHDQYIAPISTELTHTNKKLQTEILSKLILQFNEKRDKVDIYLLNKKIGFIDFKSYLEIEKELPKLKSIELPKLKSIELPYIFMDHIELDSQYRKKNIAINVLFLFMETLAAYYAPSSILLAMIYCKQMHTIAFELEFANINNIYI